MNKTRIYKRLSKATINGRSFLEGEKVTVTQRDGMAGTYVFHDLYWDCDMIIICLCKESKIKNPIIESITIIASTPSYKQLLNA